MGIIKLFKATDKTFTSNGDKTLHPRKCIVHHELNGEWYAEIECSIDYADYVKQDAIVVIDGQAYRFNNPSFSRNMISVQANHISKDTKNYTVTLSTTDTVENIMMIMRTTYPSNTFFELYSDITATITVDFNYKRLDECILYIASLVNGAIVADNYEIAIKSKYSIETDNGQVIAVGKNIKTYQSYENWDDVVTNLIAKGDSEQVANVEVEEDEKYDIDYTKVVEFSPGEDVDTEDTTQILADLTAQANAYLDNNKYPLISYTIEPIIDKAELYEKYLLKHPRINKSLITHVYAIDYDAIKEKITKVTFGNFYDTTRSYFKHTVTNNLMRVAHDVQKVSETTKAQIKTTENSINATVENMQTQTSASIEALETEVALRAKTSELCNEISVATDGIEINSNRLTIDSDNFKLSSDGSTTQTNANITGKVVCEGTDNLGKYQFVQLDDGGFLYDYDDSNFQIFIAKGSLEVWNGTYHTQIGAHNININGDIVSVNGHTHDTSEVSADLSLSQTYGGTYYVSFSNTTGYTDVPTIGWVVARQDSDSRLKHSFADVPVDKVMQMKPLSYEFKDGVMNDKIHFGFKADELDKIFPHTVYDIVHFDTDLLSDNERKYCKDGVYRINYENLHGLEIAMIQKQQKKIEELEARIVALEGSNQA